MTDQIRENLEILAALQRADSEYDHLSRKLEGVDDAINALAEQLSVFQGQVDQGLLQLETLQKQYRADEGEVKRIESAIARSNEKLSSVKTNKEYQSMLKEIDELTLKKSDMEDRLLAMLDDIEAAERQGAILKADLADMSKEVQSRQDEIRQSAEVQRKSLAAIGEKRNDIWTRLDAKLQTLYS
ncbi:MAG: hypothetical protein HKP58_05320, partial [Desulfatitalea sp.]|nr:hypothetical protein [Desulfatitalea sp.]NNJ99813.1 hypothetical protein [Desulfatitalea sp.]